LTAAAELRVSIMDVDRAAELYVAGWTLRRIGAELGSTTAQWRSGCIGPV
jgi:hypothetical protein